MLYLKDNKDTSIVLEEGLIIILDQSYANDTISTLSNGK